MEPELLSLIQNCEVAIVYRPLESETVFSLPASLSQITLPADKNSDPLKIAKLCIDEVGTRRACVLIPGTQFDVSGTRHGKGGGWYDRFLSNIPASWTRIGVLHESRLSKRELVRKPWDEPMDFLAIQTEAGWRYIETRSRL